jgi:hypothetical protein
MNDVRGKTRNGVVWPGADRSIPIARPAAPINKDALALALANRKKNWARRWLRQRRYCP